MNKRSAIFIILSIFLLIILGAYFSFKGMIFPSSSQAPKNTQSQDLTCSFTGPQILETSKVGTFTSTSKGNIKSYAWSSTWSPVGETPISSIASTFNWSGPTPGIYTISLTVSDLKESKSCQGEIFIK